MKVVLLGAPGSGKGTISEYLINQYGFIHLSTGNLFRKIMDEKGPYWEELKSYVSKGLLVSDELTNKIVEATIQNFNNNDSFILDGYPRTIKQADFLATIIDIDAAIYLHVAYDILEKRLTGRRICNKCKRIYNIYFNKPKNDNICDDDHEILMQRKDDQKEVINDRMKVYQTNSFPLIDYYEKLNKLFTIQAESIDIIHSQVDNLLNQKFHMGKK